MRDSSDAIAERARRVVVRVLKVDTRDVGLSTSFVEDLNCDSLDLVELICSIEEEFEDWNVFITDEDAERIATVQDVVDHVARVATDVGALNLEGELS